MNNYSNAEKEEQEQVKIRDAVKADISSMVRLLHELFSIEADFNPNSDKQQRGLEWLLLDKSACIIVAEHDESVIGMCTMQSVISTAEGGVAGLLEDLVVTKEFRGQGIGRILLQNMEKKAAERGMNRIQLLTDKNNDSALGFYKKQDWQSTDLICMRRIV